MSESNAVAPIGDPNAGDNQSNLSVVPDGDKTPRTQGDFNKEVEAELSKSAEIFTLAQKPEYAAKLALAGIDAEFVTGLVNLVLACGKKSQGAVNCDNAAGEATQNQGDAKQTLMSSLRTIQSAGRQKHLPDNPAGMDNYLAGQKLDATHPLLERNSQSLIDRAEAERPGAIKTDFIVKAQGQLTSFVDEKNKQGAEESKAAQDRAQRDKMLADIVAGRKKIQYAADTLWPPRKPESVQARKDFKLPLTRPYSY